MITEVSLLRFGICKTDNESITPEQNSLTSYFLHSESISFLTETDKIQLKPGLQVGIEYLLKGEEEENAEWFSVRIRHPLLTNPETNRSAVEVTETKAGGINESGFDYFHFEYDWEMKPGAWIFQVIQSDRILLQKEFDLLR